VSAPFAAIEFSFELDRERLAPGETVSGHVVARCERPVGALKGAKVHLVWFSEGEHRRRERTPLGDEVWAGFPATVKPGAPQRGPFSLTVPREAPLSYEGTLFRVACAVEITVPHGVHATGGELRIESGPETVDLPSEHAGPAGAPPEREVAAALRELLANPVLWAMNVLGLLCLYAGVIGNEWDGGLQQKGMKVLSLIGAALFLSIGTLWPLLAQAQLSLARRARAWLGDLLVQVPTRVRPGERVSVELTSSPRGEGTLERVVATLRGWETVRAEKTGKVHLHDVHRAEVEFARGLALGPSQPLELVGQIEVPADAGPSFQGRASSLCWTLELALEVEGGLDWRRTYRLHVLP